MTDWTEEELRRIAAARELELRPTRPDGSLRRPVTIRVVRVGDEPARREGGSRPRVPDSRD